MNSLREIIAVNERASRCPTCRAPAGRHTIGCPHLLDAFLGDDGKRREVVVAVPLAAVKASALIAELMRRGWRHPERDDGVPWLSLAELAAQCGRQSNSLCRTIQRRKGKCPGLEVERAGVSRKIVRLRATPAFFQWLGVTKKGAA